MKVLPKKFEDGAGEECREAAYDFSPAFQGREQVAQRFLRRVATHEPEKTLFFSRRYATDDRCGHLTGLERPG